MSTKKRSHRQPPSRLDAANAARSAKAKAAQKERQASLAKLKRAGLYTGDSRKGAKTSHGARLVKQYADVISGKAKAVKADTNTEVAFRGAGGRGAHGRVVIETEHGEKVRFNKKAGVIEGKRTAYGNTTIRRVYFQKVFDPKKLPSPKKGVTYYYQARFPAGVTPRFDNKQSLLDYMNAYKNAVSGNEKVVKKFQEYWASQVSVYAVTGDDSDIDWSEIDEAEE